MENPQTIENKLESCKLARTIAAKSLYTTLSLLLNGRKPISEAELRDTWLEQMQKEDAIFPEGWYSPPPNGIVVLFGTANDTRLDYRSLRPEDSWPKSDIYLDEAEGLLYAYASPVHKKTGIIGDFGITLYFGTNKELQELLKTALELDRSIQKEIKPGQKLSEIYELAEQTIKKAALDSKITSITDPASLNIGHTVPASYESWTDQQKGYMATEKMASVISQARRFISPVEILEVQQGMALTIEPRPKAINQTDLPMVSYHTICLIHTDGRTELLENFDDLFRLARMDYMLTQ